MKYLKFDAVQLVETLSDRVDAGIKRLPPINWLLVEILFVTIIFIAMGIGSCNGNMQPMH